MEEWVKTILTVLFGAAALIIIVLGVAFIVSILFWALSQIWSDILAM